MEPLKERRAGIIPNCSVRMAMPPIPSTPARYITQTGMKVAPENTCFLLVAQEHHIENAVAEICGDDYHQDISDQK